MKKFLLLICAFSLFLACKKEKEDPIVEPEPVGTGSVIIQVEAFDSLGDPLADKSGVRVRLNASNTLTTDATGKVTFADQPYETYIPELFREGWQGPPMQINVNAPTQSLTIPFARRSAFRLQNLVVDHIAKDSITVSFNLDKAIPNGKVCKVAIITGENAGVTGNNYESGEVLHLSSSNVSKYNIVRLSKLGNYIASIDSSKSFYINAIPISYGEFQTNLLPKPILLGENLFAPAPIKITKNWRY